ncbi:MAG TPA: hypothetical protein VJN96_00850 [Vicinamibacterales bacterium]|nr:hypothetical protein [Vicinamibacterales bacterium]
MTPQEKVEPKVIKFDVNVHHSTRSLEPGTSPQVFRRITAGAMVGLPTNRGASSTWEDSRMTKLERATNIAMILLCLAIVVDIASRHTAPAAANTASGATAEPNVYKIGDVFKPSMAFRPELGRRTLLLMVRDGCKFCEASAPFYRTLVDAVRNSGSDVQLVGVCINPDDVCAAYFKKEGVAVDRTVGTGPGVLKIRGTPTLVLVDATGKVSSVWIGQQNADGEKSILTSITTRPKSTRP